MAFEKESKFGVIKIDGKAVKLYSSPSSYTTINTGNPVKDARWAGNELIIYLNDNKVRKYKTPSSYITIH